MCNEIFSGNQPHQYKTAVPTFQRPFLSTSSENDVMGDHRSLLIHITYAPSCMTLDQWGLQINSSWNQLLWVTVPGASSQSNPICFVIQQPLNSLYSSSNTMFNGSNPSGHNSSYLSHHSLMMEEEKSSEMLNYCSALKQMVAWEDFTAFSHHKNFESYIK
jgi:hypothetical protein